VEELERRGADIWERVRKEFVPEDLNILQESSEEN